MASKFRSLLLRISYEISDSNLKDMKYLCTDSIPEGRLDGIVSPLMLFKELEQQGDLEIDNLAFLQDLLANIGLIKLAKDVENFNSSRQLEMFCLTNLKDREARGHRRNLSSGVSDEENTPRSTATTTGECNKQVLPMKSNACCSLHPPLCHQSELQRNSGEIYLKIAMELATKGAWIAGTAFILKRYINNPTDLARLFGSVVLPSGILVKFLCRGSIVCVLEATELQGVQTLWADFKSGTLQHALEKVLVTEDLKALADGQKVILKVELDEEMYREVCLELILARQKARDIWWQIQQRPRSKSDPGNVHFAEKPCNSNGSVKNTFQQDSFCLMANVERKRRLRAEKKLQDYKFTIQPQFPELLNNFGDKNNKATGLSCDESDDSSESSSTCDEEDVLEWEDEMEVSNLFWSSVKGSIKEKSWSDFEDTVQRKLMDEVNAGGIPLMSFLTYVLQVNYATRAKERVSLSNFIKLTRWFGPFIEGPKGCLSKMMDLMKNSVSVGADGKITSWFAGYTTDSQAKEKLTNEKPGTFLVRFSSSNVTQGFILSRKSRDHGTVLDFPIEVNKETGFVEFGDKIFPTLPRLIEELRNTWMEDLYPFHSAEVIGSQLP